MEVIKKLDLYKYNTMRLHCIADTAIFPNSYNELVSFISSGEKFVVLGGGSNVILPETLHTNVVLLQNLPDEIEVNDEEVACGASVRIQKLIRECQKQSLGGFEYLYSVPCMVGGAVYMNAGRGEIFNQSISDYIIGVDCYNVNTQKFEVLSKDECHFAFRRSVFHDNTRIILRVHLKLEKSSFDDIESRIKERLEISKKNLDASKPSSGSIFLQSSPKIMKLIKGVRIGGACWSKKTDNWISNDRNGRYKDVVKLIRIVQILHRLLNKKCCREVIIYK